MVLAICGRLFQRACQLVGTRGGFCAASDAAQAFGHTMCVLAFDECADSLQVAVASARETDVVQAVVTVDVEFYQAAAGACRAVFEMHGVSVMKGYG